MPHPVEAWRRLPLLVRFLVCHALVGFVLSAVFVGGFLLADPQGSGTLLLTAAGHWWPALVLWFFVGLTFGAVQMGAATMLLGEERGTRHPPRGTGVPGALAPALLRVRPARRR